MSETTPPTISTTFPFVTQEYLEEVGRLGDAIYEELKPQLEPAYNNQFITIHVDNGDYAIGKNSSIATRALLERHPVDGRLFTRKIGDELEYGLIARILASDMRKAQQK